MQRRNMPFGLYNKYSTIHMAVMSSDHKKLEELLKAGANPDQPDQNGG